MTMFKRISYRIALQFMAFVFGMLLINGAVFLAIDLKDAQHRMEGRLLQASRFVIEQSLNGLEGLQTSLPPALRDRVRIVNKDGTPQYSGGLFSSVPFSPVVGIRTVRVEEEDYSILTANIVHNNQLVGYIQIAEVERLQLGDLPERALLYLLVSIGISLLTFLVGLFFARRSLKPAVQMMERLEQFTQDASHELRTPLAALNSSLDLAMKTGKHHEGILSAKEDVKDIVTLIERLLELTRLDAFTLAREPVALSGLVEECIQTHQMLIKESTVTIESAITPNVTVRGDAALIRRVVSNLLSNAIKFSKPEGGVISVRLTKDMLQVTDTGIGIPQESLPHIFNRFYQTDTSRRSDAEGFGLGLALVKRIVDLHGWTVRVESELAKGTTFRIRLRGEKGEPKAAGV